MTGLNLSLRSQGKGRAVPGTHFKRPGSAERMIGANGEINANSRADLIAQVAMLIEASANGQIDDTAAGTPISSKERSEILCAAFNDRTGSQWNELGASIAGTLTKSAERDGFMRKLLKEEEAVMGQPIRVRVRRKSITALASAGSGNVYPIIARDDYYYPAEITISANVRIERRELNQGSSDILNEKFLEANEQIMVEEDRNVIATFRKTVGITHPLQTLVGGLSVASFTHMISLIESFNIPVATCVMASDYKNDLIASPSFGTYYDPVTKYELLQQGFLGRILNIDLISDATRHPTLKVLNQGEMFLLSDPINLGAYATRGPVESQEVNEANLGSNARGFFMSEEIATLVHNPRSVVVARRA